MVTTLGAMEEDATTEGIEEKCDERSQICHELRVLLLELNTHVIIYVNCNKWRGLN